MRLVRRSLLCLVVGVTAFGAAGWMLRPRPTWTVRYDGVGDRPFVVCSDTNGAEAVAWVIAYYAKPSPTGNTQRTLIELRRLADGTILHQFDLAGSCSAFPRRSGELLVEQPVGTNVEEASTLWLYSTHSEAPRFTTTLYGHWEVVVSGSKAVRELRDNGKITVSVVDLVPGSQVATFTFPAPPDKEDRFETAASDDGTLYATTESDDDRDAPLGCLLYSLETGKRLARVVPRSAPMGWTAPRASGLQFSDDGRSLRFDWAPRGGGYRRYRYDLETGNCLEDTSEASAPPAPPSQAKLADACNGGGVLVALDDSGPTAWYSVDAGEGSPHPWRRYPFPLMPFWRDYIGIRFSGIPGRHEFIAEAYEPSLAYSLPRAILELGPDKWKFPRGEWVVRWHDWKANAWRVVGRFDDWTSCQFVPGAVLVAMMTSDSHWLVQSWPLPPRDPKPLALAIAALCIAGTWWLCAWRYRRRTRLASVGAA